MMVNPNSMLIWYPKLQEAGVPVPRTTIIRTNWGRLTAWMDGREDAPYLEQLCGRLGKAAAAIGYPVFLRTDLCAGKHGWTHTCYVKGPENLRHNLFGVVEANMVAGVVGLQFKALAVREFLTLESYFTAFKGMPIAREFRFFAKGGEILCHHPYWPEEAIRFYGQPEPQGWRGKLRRLSEEPSNFAEAEEMVKKASAWTEEPWSIDVCRTVDKKWYVTDMALGKASYHWPGCSAAPQEAEP